MVAATDMLKHNFAEKPVQMGLALHGTYSFFSFWPKDKWAIS